MYNNTNLLRNFRRQRNVSVFRYRVLRYIGYWLIFLIAVGLVGTLWIGMDHPAVLGNSYLLAYPLLSAGLLYAVWNSETKTMEPSAASIRIYLHLLGLLVIGSYVVLQMYIALADCPDPAVYGGDPVLSVICTTDYALLITSIVYAWVALATQLVLGVVEIALVVAVRKTSRAWKLYIRATPLAPPKIT